MGPLSIHRQNRGLQYSKFEVLLAPLCHRNAFQRWLNNSTDGSWEALFKYLK